MFSSKFGVAPYETESKVSAEKIIRKMTIKKRGNKRKKKCDGMKKKHSPNEKHSVGYKNQREKKELSNKTEKEKNCK